MSFIHNAWYAAGWSQEIGQGLVARKFLNEPVVLFRDRDGKAAALADRCPHRFAPLHLGKLRDGILECGYHGLCFDAGGACIRNPHGDGTIVEGTRVKSYRLAERDGIAWIWMGDPALADEAKIRDFPQFGRNPRYVAVYGALHVAANYQLISDNLLDLTHGQYIHPMFSNAAGPATLERSDHTDAGTVWAKFIRKSQHPNKYFQFLGYPAERLGDHRNYMRWNPPAVLLLDVGMTGVGEPPEQGISIPTAHLITPETETTSHYFWAMARDFRLDDEAFSQSLFAIGIDIFTREDKPMIEAQQRNMGEATDLMALKPVLLTTDVPAVRARRIVQRLIGEEEASPRAVAQ